MANFLINTIKKVTLDAIIHLSQIYDGVGNIGKVKGAVVTFCLKTVNDKDVLLHYAFHELNLCLSKTSKVPQRFNSAVEVLGIF